jgi:hypothetical protein
MRDEFGASAYNVFTALRNATFSSVGRQSMASARVAEAFKLQVLVSVNAALHNLHDEQNETLRESGYNKCVIVLFPI